MILLAENDKDLGPWIWGILENSPTRPGDFLKALAEAAVRADHRNYAILRPALSEIHRKYPEYRSEKEF